MSAEWFVRLGCTEDQLYLTFINKTEMLTFWTERDWCPDIFDRKTYWCLGSPVDLLQQVVLNTSYIKYV